MVTASLAASTSTSGSGLGAGAPSSHFYWLVLPLNDPLFALEKTADYYVVAYTKIGPTCSIACDF